MLPIATSDAPVFIARGLTKVYEMGEVTVEALRGIDFDMRKLLAALVAVAFVAALGVPAVAAAETITGKLIDQGCYLKDKVNNAGVDHKMPADMAGCAVMCAKKGMPLALLTTHGKVYTIKGGLAADNNTKFVGTWRTPSRSPGM